MVSFIFSIFRSLLLFSLLSLCVSIPVLSAAEVVVMKGQNAEPYNEVVSGLTEGLGFIPEVYELGGSSKAARRLAQKLSISRPGLVISLGTMASVAASEEIKDIPVVYLMVSRPEVYLKNSANVTGISLNPDPKDQFDLLQRFYPSATRIGIIFNPDHSLKEIENIKKAALPGYEVVEETVSRSSQMPTALKNIRGKSDILWLVMDNDLLSRQTFEYIVKFSVLNKYPVLGFSRSTVNGGALISAVSDYKNIGIEGAKLVKKILSGDKQVLSTPSHYQRANGYAYNKRVGKLINRSLAFKVEP